MPASGERFETAGDDGAEPGDWIAEEAHLLALRKGTGAIVDRHFDREVPAADQLADELEIEVEALAAEDQPLDALAAKHLVHRGGIARLRREQPVHQPGEELVREVHHHGKEPVVAELPDLPGPPTHVAGPQHDGGGEPQARGSNPAAIARRSSVGGRNTYRGSSVSSAGRRARSPDPTTTDRTPPGLSAARTRRSNATGSRTCSTAPFTKAASNDSGSIASSVCASSGSVSVTPSRRPSEARPPSPPSTTCKTRPPRPSRKARSATPSSR